MTKIIAGNWKSLGQKKFLENFLGNFKTEYKNEVVLFLPKVYLESGRKILPENIKTGSQKITDIIFDEEKVVTGEVEPDQLEDVGVSYVLVGHSERRSNFCENYENQLKNAEKKNFNVIFCVGETLEERENNIYRDIILQQLEIIKNFTNNIIIAYEPVWAIGTGKIPTIDEIKEVIDLIRKNYSNKVLYGGSVNLKISSKILEVTDGVLIGRMSLSTDFFKICEN